MIEKSCGTLPYTVRNGEICYLLIRAKDSCVCGFPKGHVEPNETEIETALRETFEETSLTVTVTDGFRYETSYPMNNGNVKSVVYFLADFKDGQPKHNDGFEDFEHLILPFDQAYQMLTFDNTKDLLKKANDFMTAKSNI